MAKKFGFLLLGLGLLFLSCEVGLGPAVDTNPPEVEIKSPSIGAIIRDEFAVSGTWSDDGSISSVKVTLNSVSKDSSGNSKYTVTYDAEVNGNDGNSARTWSAVVDPFKSHKEVPDGKYLATIVISDNGGHSSSATREFVVDNTPPLIVLQRPSSKSNALDSQIDSFGQSFTLKGQAADDNDVDHINITIFEDSIGTTPLKTITLNNVPPTIELDVAKFVKGQVNSYSEIYGSTEISGTKKLYCAIEAYDSAQLYPSDGSNQSPADTNGNCTTTYYLYNDLADVLSEYKITELYQMMNGSYASSGDRAAASISSQVLQVLKNNALYMSSFILDPKNNPKFSIATLSPLSLDGTDFVQTLENGSENVNYKKIENSAAGSDVVIKVEVGLDSFKLQEDTLKVYLLECDDNGAVLSGAAKIYPDQDAPKGSSTYEIKCTIKADEEKGLLVGKKYIFGVDGTDIKDNNVISGNDNGYGFVLAPSGTPPELVITYPEETVVYKKKSDSVTIKGYTIVEAGTVDVSVNYGDSVFAAKTLTDAVDYGTKKKYLFEFTIPAEKFSQTESKQYGLEISAKQEGNPTSFNRTVMYDVEGPVVTLLDDSPKLTSYIGAYGADATGVRSDGLSYINGKVTFKGNAIDGFGTVEKVDWYVIVDNKTVSGIGAEGLNSVFTFEFDTEALVGKVAKADEVKATVVIVAHDNAGNDSKNNFEYFIDQKTDIPTFEADDGSWKKGILVPSEIKNLIGKANKYNIISSGGKLYSALSDDDGVAKVVFDVIPVTPFDTTSDYDSFVTSDGKLYVNGVLQSGTLSAAANAAKAAAESRFVEVYGTDANPKNRTVLHEEKTLSKTEPVNHQMPSSSGYYLVKEKVTDKVGKTASAEFLVLMAGTAPEVSLSSNKSYIATGSSVTASMVIDGVQPYTIVRRVYKVNGSSEVQIGETTTVTIQNTPTEADPYTNDFTLSSADIPVEESTYTKIRIEYSVTDDTGGTSTKSKNFTIDNSKPTMTITSPGASAIGSGSLSGSEYVFRGNAKDTGVAGMSSLMYAITKTAAAPAENSNAWTTVEASDGTWVINKTLGTGVSGADANALYEGTYYIHIKGVDAAGNVSDAISRKFAVDQSDPVLTEVNTESFYVNSSNISGTNVVYTLSGKITETNGLKSMVITETGVAAPVHSFTIGNKSTDEIKTNPDNQNWTYTFTVPKADIVEGEHIYTITAKDDADRSVSLTRKVVIDIQKPVVDVSKITIPTENQTENSSFKFTGADSCVKDNGGSGFDEIKVAFTSTNVAPASADFVETIGTNGNWASIVEFSNYSSIFASDKQGTKYLWVNAYDKAGNSSGWKSKSFVYDVEKPSIIETTLGVDGSYKKADFAIGGTVFDSYGIKNVVVSAYKEVSGVYATTASKTWTYTTESGLTASGSNYTWETNIAITGSEKLDNGKYKIIALVTDNANKPNSVERIVTLDNVAPTGTATITTTANNGWYNTTTLELELSGIVETGSGVKNVVAKAFASSVAAADRDFSTGTTSLYLQDDGTYTGTIRSGLTNGSNVVCIQITDNANNVRQLAISSVRIDTAKPDNFTIYDYVADNTDYSTKTEKSGAIQINGTNDAFEFAIVTSDGTGESGIASIVYKYGNNAADKITVLAADAIATNTYKLTIPKNSGGKTYQKNGVVKIYVIDNAGNEAEFTPFSFESDTNPPTVTIDNLADADRTTDSVYDINGTVTLSGTASDVEGNVTGVKVQYLASSSEIADTSTIVWEGASKTAGVTALAAATGTANWTYSIDTSSLDKKYFYFRVEATDKAGNKGYGIGSQKLYINQDSDRPVISFTNLDLSQADKWLQRISTLSGTITDDDGIYKFWYKEKGAANWTEIEVTNSSWSIENIGDGSHEFYFKVEDTAQGVYNLTGTPKKYFETNATATASTLLQPKLKSEKTVVNAGVASKQASWIGAGATGTVSVQFKVDMTSPKYITSTVEYATATVESATWSSVKAEVNATSIYYTDEVCKTHATASTTDTTTVYKLVYGAWSNDPSTLYFGGKNKFFKLRFKVWDENGINTVKIKFPEESTEWKDCSIDTTGVANAAAAKLACKTESTARYWTYEDMPISASLNGSKRIGLEIVDYGTQKKEDSFSITVDNTKPEISITSHRDGVSVFGSSDVTVVGSVDSNDLKNWYYVVSKNQTLTNAEIANYKELKGNQTFRLVFDGQASNATETHESTLFDILLTQYSLTKAELEADDTERPLYIHVYGEDYAGNISENVKLHLNVIPNGDKPSVAFTYPDPEGTDVLGGTIRVTGMSQIADKAVDKVYIQIDPEPFTEATDGEYVNTGTLFLKHDKKKYTQSGAGTDEDPYVYTESATGTYTKATDNNYYLIANSLYKMSGFTDAWETHLTAYDTTTKHTVVTTGGTVANKQDKGIEVSGLASSWNYTINQYGEFDDCQYIALRIFAKNNAVSPKFSDSTDVCFQMDKNAPKIGSTVPLRLVQYESGNSGKTKASQNYEAGMWIKGEWYLTGSVEDDSGIKLLTVKEGDKTAETLVKIETGTNNGQKDSTKVSYFGKKVSLNSQPAGWPTGYYTDEACTTAATTYADGDYYTAAKDTNFNYMLNIPVGKSTGYGSLSYTITANEATSQGLPATRTIELNYDNTAPDFGAARSDVLNAKDLAQMKTYNLPATGNIIKQSSGSYSFYGYFDESGNGDNNQSGFDKVLMFFKRTRTESGSSVTYLIDPMLNGGNTGLANFIPVAKFETPGADGVYWFKKLNGTVSNSSTITLDAATLKTNGITDVEMNSIRKGGVVKIGGVMYLINSVYYGTYASASATWTSAPSVTVVGTFDNGAMDDIYFAMGQVIDNLTTESQKTAEFNFATDLARTTNDDGDQMVEGVTKSGALYTWSAGIDSSLVMDGPVDVTFVAFDKAGNSDTKTYSATVENNAPRLFGVKYGTDKNTNGVIDDDEWVTDYDKKYSVLSAGTYYDGYENNTETQKTSISIEDRVTVKGKTTVIPQIAGGNINLQYKLAYKADDASGNATGTEADVIALTSYTTDHSASTTARNIETAKWAAVKAELNALTTYFTDTKLTTPVTAGTSDATIVYKEVAGYDSKFGITFDAKTVLQKNITDGKKHLYYKVYDETDGTTVGTGSCAQIILPVNIAIQDEEAPVVKVNPFYWNSSSDNSLYQNSKANGHIELETDWEKSSKYDSSKTTGIEDKDPKVSGFITFAGQVTDNVFVKEISVAAKKKTDTWDYYTDEKSTIKATAETSDTTDVYLHYVTAKWSDVKTEADATNTYYTDTEFTTKATAATTDTTDVYKVGAKYKWKDVKRTYYTDAECKTEAASLVDGNEYYYKILEPITIATRTSDTDSTWILGSNTNWNCEISEDIYDEEGKNIVDFKFNINTACVDNVAELDVIFDFVAKDKGKASLSGDNINYTPKSSDLDTDQTTIDSKTSHYRVDIVPYVTELKTNLSKLESSNIAYAKTAYSRTALGYYPIAQKEKVEIVGFNFGSKAEVKIGSKTLEQGTADNDSIPDVLFGKTESGEVKVDSSISSGKLTVTVNGILNINDLNATGDDAAEYNIIDNNANNATLSDDVAVKVWEFKTIASPEVAEYVTYPTVKINPVTGMIGASFSNDFYWHMPGFSENTQSVAPSAVTAASYGNWRTQTPFMKGYEGGDQNTFSFDSNGYSYGAVQWRNREKVAEGGYFNFYFSRAKTEANMSTANAYVCNSGSSRLEANCLNLLSSPSTSHLDSEWKTNNMRIKSPSIVAVPNTDSSNTTVHIAYFDSSTGQLRYRKGAVNAKGVNVQPDSSYSNNVSAAQSAMRLEGANKDSLKDVFDYKDQNGNWTVYTGGSTRGTGGTNYPYSNTQSTDSDGNYRAETNNNIGQRDKKPADSLQTHSNQVIHVLASNGVDGDVQDIYKKSHYTYGAGKFLSMGILSDNKTVVIAWYDEIAQKVYLTYGDTSDDGDFKNANTTIVNTTNHTATFNNSYARTTIWENHTNEIGSGGAYVQMAVGTDNKIHIAYYDNVNGGVVKYVRGSIDTSKGNNAQFVKEVDVIVDSHGDVGSELTLNIGKDSSGNTVPYIGYFSRNYAKVAYRVDFTEDAAETVSQKGVGAINNIYTHKWEVSYVPSEKTLYGGQENRVNVAVWTKTNGDLGKAVSGTNTSSKRGDKGTSWGKTDAAGSNSFANGTNNPIVAYVSSTGSLEYGQIVGDNTEIVFK